jgi:hypothetical protein
MSIKNNRAFPSQPHDRQGCALGEPHFGMTLLDYFAGQALNGMLADYNRIGEYRYYAFYAYNFAESMLQERERRMK